MAGALGPLAAGGFRRRFGPPEGSRTAFFRRFPGTIVLQSRWLHNVLSGTGRRLREIRFLDWIRRSGRSRLQVVESCQREVVQGSFCWYRFVRTLRNIRVTSSIHRICSSTSSEALRSDRPLPVATTEERLAAWPDQRSSEWHQAASVYYQGAKAEQLFIVKVVSNVEVYARSGITGPCSTSSRPRRLSCDLPATKPKPVARMAEQLPDPRPFVATVRR